MYKLLATSMLVSLLTIPAFAQDSELEISCAEFIALDAEAQEEAMASSAGAGETAEVSAEAVVRACGDNPALTLPLAMEEAQRN